MPRLNKAEQQILDFQGLANYEASTAKEGQIDFPVFENFIIRRIIFKGEPYYSVLDVIGVLTEKTDRNRLSAYWSTTKDRMASESERQPLTNCEWLHLPSSDKKMRSAECANISTLLRIIQSIPTKKAEPFKQWLAKIGFERIQETAEPSRLVKRMVQAYRDLGYSDDWIDERMQQASADIVWDGEVDNRGVNTQGKTHIRSAVHKESHGVAPKDHRKIKGVKANGDLPDKMNTVELLIDRLGKTAGTEIMRARETDTHKTTREACIDGAKIAGDARRGIESQIKRSIITKGRELPKPDEDRM